MTSNYYITFNNILAKVNVAVRGYAWQKNLRCEIFDKTLCCIKDLKALLGNHYDNEEIDKRNCNMVKSFLFLLYLSFRYIALYSRPPHLHICISLSWIWS